MVTRADQIAASEATEFDNVVPFARRRFGAPAATLLTVTADARPAPNAPRCRAVLGPALFLACSLAVHAGVYVLLSRPPQPLASVGVVAMSLEIVLGADVTAGLDTHPTEAEAMTTAALADAPAGETEPAVKPEPGEASPVEQEVAEPVSATDQDRSAALLQPQADDVSAPPAPPPPPLPTQAPDVAAPPEPAPPRLTEPQRHDVGSNRPERVQRSPVSVARAHPHQPTDTAQRRRAGQEARTASAAAAGSSGIGRGRSDADSNYRGLVAAHLARYKRFPADAQARGDHGSTIVSFGIDGNGRVTSVRLVSASGIGSIDQESQAMVRRASPVPPPPSGHAMTVTVPLSFDPLR